MGQAAVDLILLGALPTIGIAVVADWIWQILIGCFQTGGRS
jgi:ABC-type proline/glycine betaine transport system permease subunit